MYFNFVYHYQYVCESGVWAQAYSNIWNSVSNFLGSILSQWILGSTLQVIGLAQQVLLLPTEISHHLSLNTLYKLRIHCCFVTIKCNFNITYSDT